MTEQAPTDGIEVTIERDTAHACARFTVTIPDGHIECIAALVGPTEPVTWRRLAHAAVMAIYDTVVEDEVRKIAERGYENRKEAP